MEEEVQAGSTPRSTSLPRGLAPESCCLCPLGRQDPLGIPPAGAGGGDAPALPKRSRETPEVWMPLSLFGQGGSIPSSGGSLQTRPGCPRWDGLSCRGSASSVKDLAPDPGQGCQPWVSSRQVLPSMAPLLSLPGQVPGAPAAPGRSCAKDQTFPGVLGSRMRSQRCWWADLWGQDGPGCLQGGCPSPCPCMAAG